MEESPKKTSPKKTSPKKESPKKQSTKTAAMRSRVHASRSRLKSAPGSKRRGPQDPATGESWHGGHVLGHTAEMLVFWTPQIRAAARSGSGEIGRREAGAEKRRHGIDRGEAASDDELLQAVDDGIGDLLVLLDELTDDELEIEVVFHGREGVRPARLEELLESLLIGHLEEHAEQLASLHGG